MFDQMKAFGAIAGLMKNKERIREIGEEFQRRLERIDVEGSAGGGAVRVSASGKMRVTSVHIDPAAIAGLGVGEGGREMVQSLVLDATNDALSRAQVRVQEEARRMAQELDLPDIPGMDRLLGGG
jgi:DNA-binding YbaB/EbfC family protein